MIRENIVLEGNGQIMKRRSRKWKRRVVSVKKESIKDDSTGKEEERKGLRRKKRRWRRTAKRK